MVRKLWGGLLVAACACGSGVAERQQAAAPPVTGAAPTPSDVPAAPDLRVGDVVRTSGPCGESTAQLLDEAEASAMRIGTTGRLSLLLRPGGDGARQRVLRDRPTGRETPLPASVLAVAPDDLRVLVRNEHGGPAWRQVVEVEPQTGATRLLLDGARVSTGTPIPGGTHLLLHETDDTPSRRVWLYRFRDGHVEELGGAAGVELARADTPPGAPLRFLVRDGGEVFFWEEGLGRRWGVAGARTVVLASDGTGVMLVDAEGRVSLRTPEGSARETSVTLPTGSDTSFALRRVGVLPTGLALYRPDFRFPPLLWDVRAGNVRQLAAGVWWGEPDARGQHITAQRKHPDGGYAYEVHDLTTGASRTVLRRPGSMSATWSPSGALLAITARLSADDVEDHSPRTVHLVRAHDGAELPLDGAVGGFHFSDTAWPAFHQGERYLGVSSLVGYRLYSVTDGARLYAMDLPENTWRLPVWFRWGEEDVLYGHGGSGEQPIDDVLVAWNPRTGVETELGRHTLRGCFAQGYRLFRHDVPSGDFDPSPLVAWHPETGARVQLSARAMSAVCVPGRSAVLMSDGPTQVYPGDTWVARLVYVDLATGCRQTLLEGSSWPQLQPDGSVQARTAAGPWRVTLPGR